MFSFLYIFIVFFFIYIYHSATWTDEKGAYRRREEGRVLCFGTHMILCSIVLHRVGWYVAERFLQMFLVSSASARISESFLCSFLTFTGIVYVIIFIILIAPTRNIFCHPAVLLLDFFMRFKFHFNLVENFYVK